MLPERKVNFFGALPTYSAVHQHLCTRPPIIFVQNQIFYFAFIREPLLWELDELEGQGVGGMGKSEYAWINWVVYQKSIEVQS